MAVADALLGMVNIDLLLLLLLLNYYPQNLAIVEHATVRKEKSMTGPGALSKLGNMRDECQECGLMM
jgi:hypothetical protein